MLCWSFPSHMPSSALLPAQLAARSRAHLPLVRCCSGCRDPVAILFSVAIASKAHLLVWHLSKELLSTGACALHTCGTSPSAHLLSLLLSMFSSVGQVVNIKAKVNRAFNSSMEVCVLQPCFAPCVHPWHVAVPASCTLCAVATCRIPAYCSVLWLGGCAVCSAHSGSAWSDAAFTHAPAAAWAPNCSLSPVLGFKIPNYTGHHCASPAAFSPLLSQEEIFGVRNPCTGLQKLPALCWWCWLNISPCHPYMWLRGPVLCPLSGGHPGELRGPAQREALQHLQGLCHLRGAGSPGHQGKCCAVSPMSNLQETTSAIGAGGRWGCA